MNILKKNNDNTNEDKSFERRIFWNVWYSNEKMSHQDLLNQINDRLVF